MTKPKTPPPADLFGATERLILGIVKQAGRKVPVKETKDGKTKTRYVPANILDQARAADAALKFLAMKNKMPEPPAVSDFERGMMELDDERNNAGSGRGASPETSIFPNRSAAH